MILLLSILVRNLWIIPAVKLFYMWFLFTISTFNHHIERRKACNGVIQYSHSNLQIQSWFTGSFCVHFNKYTAWFGVWVLCASPWSGNAIHRQDVGEVDIPRHCSDECKARGKQFYFKTCTYKGRDVLKLGGKEDREKQPKVVIYE